MKSHKSFGKGTYPVWERGPAYETIWGTRNPKNVKTPTTKLAARRAAAIEAVRPWRDSLRFATPTTEKVDIKPDFKLDNRLQISPGVAHENSTNGGMWNAGQLLDGTEGLIPDSGPEATRHNLSRSSRSTISSTIEPIPTDQLVGFCPLESSHGSTLEHENGAGVDRVYQS